MSGNKKDFNTNFTLLDKKTNMQRIEYVKRQISELIKCYSYLQDDRWNELYEGVDCWIIHTSVTASKKIAILPKSVEVNSFIGELEFYNQHDLFLSNFKTKLKKLGQYTIESHDADSAMVFLCEHFLTNTE